MPGTFRDAWAGYIAADDYERHMAVTGQPQANASLLAELFAAHAPDAGARILFAGAGTGQYFDYWPPAALTAYRCVFTDINPLYLARLTARCEAETAVDDIEVPRVAGPFDLAIVILVLEHVDWRRAVSALAGIACRVFTVTQENSVATITGPLAGSMSVLAVHPPKLVERTALIREFEGLGFRLTWTAVREVANGKRMVGLDFAGAPAATRYHGAVHDHPPGSAAPES